MHAELIAPKFFLPVALSGPQCALWGKMVNCPLDPVSAFRLQVLRTETSWSTFFEQMLKRRVGGGSIPAPLILRHCAERVVSGLEAWLSDHAISWDFHREAASGAGSSPSYPGWPRSDDPTLFTAALWIKEANLCIESVVPSDCGMGAGHRCSVGVQFLSLSLYSPPRKAAMFQKDDLEQGFQALAVLILLQCLAPIYSHIRSKSRGNVSLQG